MSSQQAVIGNVGQDSAPPPVPVQERASFGVWLRRKGWRHAIALIALIYALFPIVWVVTAAFTPHAAISGTSLIPTHPSLANFQILFNSPAVFYGRWYLNTIIVAVVASSWSVLMATMAAYVFSRYRFRGRRPGMLFLLLVQMFPSFLALVAIYNIMEQLGKAYPAVGIGTLWGLILVYMGGALGVNTWLIKGFFDTIPSELDESAKVDGGTHAQTFWLVILPLAAPVLSVVFLLSFIGAFNEYVIASILLQNQKTYTLPLGLNGFISNAYQKNWGPFAAGAVLAAIPVSVLFFILQKYIVQGLTAGSVKG